MIPLKATRKPAQPAEWWHVRIKEPLCNGRQWHVILEMFSVSMPVLWVRLKHFSTVPFFSDHQSQVLKRTKSLASSLKNKPQTTWGCIRSTLRSSTTIAHCRQLAGNVHVQLHTAKTACCKHSTKAFKSQPTCYYLLLFFFKPNRTFQF